MGIRRRTEAGPLRGSPASLPARGPHAREAEEFGREHGGYPGLFTALSRLGARLAIFAKAALHTVVACLRRNYVASGVLGIFLLGVMLFLSHLGGERPGLCMRDVVRDGGVGATKGGARGRFTVVLNTYRRPDRLKKAISHYARCEGVDAVRVVWSESGNPPRGWEVPGGAKLIYDIHEKNSINNRFVPLKGVGTDAIFNVDDDMIVDCRSVLFAFETWRTSSETLVGFNPRLHTTPRNYLEKAPLSQRSLRFEPKHSWTGAEKPCQYRYRHYWYVWWHGAYSMVLTKAAFCHHKYFEMYANNLPKAVWDFVHENKNCEDIAMQFLISNATGLPPVWVRGHYRDSGVLDFSGGISVKSGHLTKRDGCLTRFAEAFGHMPLKLGRSHVEPVEDWTPIRWPAAIWEWIHPM